ncbi:MAG: ROK family protein [Pyrinomonadaceae bacterium]
MVRSAETVIETAPVAGAATKGDQLLRLIRASQPVTRTDLAERLGVDKSTVTEKIKPLVESGILLEESIEGGTHGRKRRVLSFADTGDYFVGINLGVRHTQIGATSLNGHIVDESDFVTPERAESALGIVRERIAAISRSRQGRLPRVIGVSVPGMTDANRTGLLFAPNLSWRNVDIASPLITANGTKVVVENDATAAAMFEARVRIRDSEAGLMSNFILVRSGTGIGVGLVIGSEVYRGSGVGRGVAGEFGHMTIVAGGKKCVCGNRGCWEKYASAASAASLYMGDRPPKGNETIPRFVEIVAKAENGEVRSKRTLEMIGEYLGIGFAKVILGIGIPRVVFSGRLVYAWSFIEGPIREAIGRSIIGKVDGWSIEAGEPVGSAIGGALEVAVDEYLSTL